MEEMGPVAMKYEKQTGIKLEKVDTDWKQIKVGTTCTVYNESKFLTIFHQEIFKRYLSFMKKLSKSEIGSRPVVNSWT